jgi:hypothetical protein
MVDTRKDGIELWGFCVISTSDSEKEDCPYNLTQSSKYFILLYFRVLKK